MVEAMEKVMYRILLTVAAAIGACSSSPREASMRDIGPVDHGGGQAAVGRAVDAASATGVPATGAMMAIPADQRAEDEGRRILSTAFVMVGPDRHLTVELRDGRTMLLRGVVMRAKDYCGMMAGAKGQFCGGYAAVVRARADGAPTADQAVPAAGVEAKPSEVR